jgi:TIR domain/CBS domain
VLPRRIESEVLLVSTEPVIFISHRHSDREIAETLARFVRNKTAGNARVYLSSSPDFEGPRLGQPLNMELKRALAESELVILVYTSDRLDWSYCMWECGVAVDPKDERHTSVVVVQCTADEPKPFGDQLRVDARDLDSIQAFVKALLAGNDFFPLRDAPITGFAAEGNEIREFAAELHSSLADVIPTGVGADRSTPTAPYLRVRLGSQAADQIRTSYLAGDEGQSTKIVESEGLIVEQDGAGALFGMKLGADSTLGDVLADWRSDTAHTGQEARWFEALTDQIEAALVGRLRPVKWAAYQSVKGQTDVPYVAGSRQVPDGVEFDVYMVPIAPRPVPVRERMLPIDQTYHKNAATEPLDQILLSSLIREMGAYKATRLPILDGRSARSIVHRSTINEFLADRALETGTVEGLTLMDLLVDHADALEHSYVEVPPEATIEEAMDLMSAAPGCQDVYVTDQSGAVIGWITNVMFIQD